MQTRSLLACGAVVGPFYLAVGVLQGLLREGFSFARHPLSVLANGPGGWIQTANFVISGALVLAAVVGLGQVLGPKTRGMRWFLAAFGVSMLLAAAFPADAMDGFPAGTPLGPPTTISTTGLLHFAMGALGFTALGVSALFGAGVMSRRSQPALARISLASGLAVLLGFFGGFALPSPVAGIWFAVVVGWAWLAIISVRLRRSGAASSPGVSAL
jgi:hypothetical protein